MSALFEAQRRRRECFICANVPDFIIIKSNYFQNAQKGQCFLDDFEAVVCDLRSRLTVAFAKCHIEVSVFKNRDYDSGIIK
jgi:hypothetical protein